jgi:hypothetical protein
MGVTLLLLAHYSEHLKTGHLNTGTIQFLDIFVSSFLMVLNNPISGLVLYGLLA